MSNSPRHHEPVEAADDTTLGGYVRVHDRPPAFDGPDGHPYTVSLEVERTANLRAPWSAYLVFPRWAQTGVGIVGHVETATIAECRSEEEARACLAALSLREVQDLLHRAIAGPRGSAETGAGGAESGE